MKWLPLIATVLAAGCAQAPGSSPEAPQPAQSPDTFALAEHDGAAVLRFTGLRAGPCDFAVVAHIANESPQLHWVFAGVPSQDDLWLPATYSIAVEERVEVHGNPVLAAPPSGAEGRIELRLSQELVAGKTYYLAMQSVRPAPGTQSLNASWDPACARLEGFGTELLAVFESSASGGTHATLWSPAADAEADVGSATVQEFSSKDVQLLYGGSGNRAGLLRLVVQGQTETYAKENFQVFTRAGGPGEWGILEDGAETLGNRLGLVFGTEPLAPSAG